MKSYQSKLFIGTTGPATYLRHVYYIPKPSVMPIAYENIKIDGRECRVIDTEELTGYKIVEEKKVARNSLIPKITDYIAIGVVFKKK